MLIDAAIYSEHVIQDRCDVKPTSAERLKERNKNEERWSNTSSMLFQTALNMEFKRI